MPGFFKPTRPATATEHHVTAAWLHRCGACATRIPPGGEFARFDVVEANGTEEHIKTCLVCAPAVRSQYRDAA